MSGYNRDNYYKGALNVMPMGRADKLPTAVKLIDGALLDWSLISGLDDDTVRELLTDTDLLINTIKQDIEDALVSENLDVDWLSRAKFTLSKVKNQKGWLLKEWHSRCKKAKEQNKLTNAQQHAEKQAKQKTRTLYLEAFRSAAFHELPSDLYEQLNTIALASVAKKEANEDKQRKA